MLTFDPNDPDHPRKLLSMVLLMAARDGASTVRFEPIIRDVVDMWYCIDGVWYGLVPTPQNYWTEMKRVLKAVASVQPNSLPAFAKPWWRSKPVNTWSGGVLDHQFGERTVRWAVILDERRGRETFTLTAMHPAGPRGDADALLQQVMNRHLPQPEPTT